MGNSTQHAARRADPPAACALQRGGRGLVAWAQWFAAIVLLAMLGATRADARSVMQIRQDTALFPPLERPPLAPPLRLTGSFGEYRGGHLHAGLDLSTGEKVGMPVIAPLDGRIVRVRTSGVGYGRSLYLEAKDGRLIVLGHLDAFDEPLASYVAAVQESTGEYEQDLWPDSTRFRVAAGQRLAWSGRSGTGPPHLHFEIRRGDMAINPLLAGAEVDDTTPPVLERVTFEPLDDSSTVMGGAAPWTIDFTAPSGASAAAKRVMLTGRMRLLVEGGDARANGRLTMAPWSTSMEWNGARTECRFDSVSWADGMSEVDYVYDRGRATDHGSSTVTLWAPPGFRPRVLRADAPIAREAGTIEVGRGDPERVLRVTVRDLAGGVETREITIVPDTPRPATDAAQLAALFEKPPHSLPNSRPDWSELDVGDFAPALPASSMLTAADVRFASLPGGYVRIDVVGSRWSKRTPQAISIAGIHPLQHSSGEYAAVFRPVNLPHVEPLEMVGGLPRWQAQTRTLRINAVRNGQDDGIPGFRWSVPDGALFEPAVWIATSSAPAHHDPSLSAIGPSYQLFPREHPLRNPITVEIAVPDRHSFGKLGLYRDSGSGWEFVRAAIDSAGRKVSAETRSLGSFALFRDTSAPKIGKRVPAKTPPEGAYARWALEARLEDGGSGIDARASRFEVDGQPVPSEWDSEEATLRWRPRVPPSAGHHKFRVIATDRMGNVGHASGTFVLN